MSQPLDPRSVLFITLDSCRFDTFEHAHVPFMKAVGPLHRAHAPSHFTFGSHAAMFAGFTPGVTHLRAPLLNSKFAKIFKIVGGGFPGKGAEGFTLEGRTIIEGFNRLGYATIGTGAAGWFNVDTPTGQVLGQDFQHFFYAGDTYSINRQLAWVDERLAEAADAPVFLFLNVGETHVPYYHAGADWDVADNPCVPFQPVDRRTDCVLRQRRCCEFVDRELASLLARFHHATIVICADHGDCWGEDGLWEHGISHEMTLTVPLIVRLNGRPVAAVPVPHAQAEATPSPRPSWLRRLRHWAAR